VVFLLGKDEPGYVLGRNLIEETKNLISRCGTVGDVCVFPFVHVASTMTWVLQKFDCRHIRGVVAVQPDGHDHHLNAVASTGRQYMLTSILLKVCTSLMLSRECPLNPLI
jgi:hypothetical protein